ncbi:Crp/Fnr family transcriptional regulator [Burkholderia sp. Leaf177]|uniref:Crp/Fnr family transcriptional regulator n=1 Tax=Burkholderia sp. Leaf177 TaxID=1736287 RepID=UPI000700F682|nr:Crp/Fnr family transcriptional regulator [Burkholderia sp. Leaf177]KQR78801.1 Crp/Fnr family transcriptional regulator [Burkholderia sp. Leaf177]
MLRAEDEGHTNHLLNALPTREWQALHPFLESVSLREGQVLCESGQAIEHVYFPVTAVVSLIYRMEDGSSNQVASVGAEGMIGVPVLTGGKTMPMSVQVQFEGIAYRMNATALQQQFTSSDGLRRLLLLYMQALLVQVAQTAICNRYHSVCEQVCRWLLLETDRMPGNEVQVSHQLIAEMLGVRREGISAAVGKLQDAGVVYTSRRSITVNDREGLHAHACACYGIVAREFSRLLPRVPAREEVA